MHNEKKNKKREKIKFYMKKKPETDVDTKIQKLEEAYEHININEIAYFKDFPLSEFTFKGLAEHEYTKPTEIQKQSIGYSLQGHDVLGAAKTGSGKTLAFLIPALECLYRKKWSRAFDGVGVLIITPTRELAYQIFETLRKVGAYHDFSAGLIIGGKDLHFEKKRMNLCNIVIGTPGRILQHMDENPLFDCAGLQILVLDEADRCLDMGFQHTLDSIIENLPPSRQTLLFSATQTTSVKDLARLSLKNPKYVAVHEKEEHSTPDGLRQSYIVCELNEKMSMLWSFIKSHLKMKILIFLSTCKQVKYVYEMFCRLRPGISLLALYGTLHQLRRMKIYDEFHRKERVILFATDIAARGLDFPSVNWVVQLDCPEDANEYIHRAGRTARFNRKGESLLVLLPSELAFLEQLKEKKIPIKQIQINQNKLQTVQRTMEATLARDPNLKATAQRAFVAYIKSVFLMKNKEVFNVHALDTAAYARSLGLAMPPRIRFLKKIKKEEGDKSEEVKVEYPFDSFKVKSESDSEDNAIVYSKEEFKPKKEKEKLRKDMTKEVYKFYDSTSESEDEFLQVKRENHELEDEIEKLVPASEACERENKKKKPLTKAAVAKKILRKKIVANKKIVFNEEGEPLVNRAKERVTDAGQEYEANNEAGLDINQAFDVLREEDKIDKLIFREKIREKRLEGKVKKKAKRKEEDVDDFGESSGDDGIDYSTIPDPDKIYGPKHDSDDDGSDFYHRSNSDEEPSSDNSDDIVIRSKELEFKSRPQKRKGKKKGESSKTKSKRPKRTYEDSDSNVDQEPINTGLSLAEDEELALQFLGNKR